MNYLAPVGHDAAADLVAQVRKSLGSTPNILTNYFNVTPRVDNDFPVGSL